MRFQERISTLAGLVAITLATCILVGWKYGIPILRSFLPDQVEVKAVSGVCLLLLGCALFSLSLTTKEGPNRVSKGITLTCAMAAITLAGLSLFEYFLRLNLRIDQIVATETANAIGTVFPGRMSVPLGLNVLFMGGAIVAVQTRNARWTSLFLYASFLITILFFAGFLFDNRTLMAFGPFTLIAPASGFIVLILSAGIYFSLTVQHLDLGFARIGQSGYFSAIVVLVTLGAAMLYSANKAISTIRDVAQSVRITDQYDKIGTDLSEAYTTSRSYLLTGDQSFLQATLSASTRIPTTFGKLRELSESNSAETAYISQLVRLSEEELIILSKYDLRKSGKGPNQESMIALTNQSSLLLKEIKSIIQGRLMFQEQAILAKEAESRRAHVRGMISFILGIVLVTFLLLGNYFSLRQEVIRHQNTSKILAKEKERAEQAGTAKSAFLSHMSHELRTPLNAIIGFGQILQMRGSDPLTLECADTIVSGGNHLLKLVSEILDMARIESGKMQVSIESIHLVDVVDEACLLTQHQAKERGIDVVKAEVGADVFVKADSQRLRQVLLNLISNAIKYNHSGGTVQIRSLDATSEVQTIEIVDSGPGFSSKALDSLFQPFERGENQNVDGTGLGLAVSHRLMKLMDGELVLSQTSPQGSTFQITLPSCD